jgi:superfamily II DNA or RNA helicase
MKQRTAARRRRTERGEHTAPVLLEACFDGSAPAVFAPRRDTDLDALTDAPGLTPDVGTPLTSGGIARSRPLARMVDGAAFATWLVDRIAGGEPITIGRGLAAVVDLIVFSAELVAAGHAVPGMCAAGISAWCPAPVAGEATRFEELTDAAARACGTTPAAIRAWFDRHWLEHHAERFGDVESAWHDLRLPRSQRAHWSRRVLARLAAGAKLTFQLLAPEAIADLDPDSVRFALAPRLQSLRESTLIVAPGDPSSPVALGTSPARLTELVDAEWAAARRAVKELPSLRGGAPRALELDLDAVLTFVDRKVDRLSAAGLDVVLPGFLMRRHSVSRRAQVTGDPAGLTVGSLTLTGEVLVDGGPLDGAELDALVRARADLVSLAGRWVRLDAGDRNRLAAFLHRLREPVSPADLLGGADGLDGAEISGASGWLARLLADEFRPTRAEHIGCPGGVRAELRAYQEHGLDWLAWLEANELGGVLADDMGLGKTLQVLALVAHDHTGPTLVVAPTSVCGNWIREAERFTPGLRVELHHGADRRPLAELARDADVVVTSYGVLRRAPDVAAIAWHRVVLDEAQAIKNAQTATARAARSLTATHRLALTGTPVENHLGDLWSIMTFTNPGLLGTWRAFDQRYRVSGEDPDIVAEGLAMLHRRVRPFMLRRHKTDPGIVDELPERIVVRDDCLLTLEQVAAYEATARAMLREAGELEGERRRMNVLAGIGKLKQICNHPATLVEGDRAALAGRSGKLDRLVELCAEIVAEDEAVVVFSQYAGFLTSIAAHLAAELGVEAATLTGAMSRTRRDRVVTRFGEPDGPPVLCVSLKAGGTGLNLVRANHAVHFDRWWNPAVEDQASDRVWRIGQTRGVVVHTLVCPGTVEERIAEMLERKRALASAVVTSTEAAITILSDDELAELIRLDIDAATERSTRRTARR